jgi:hypothetical protein
MKKKLCEWLGHPLIKLASEKKIDVVTERPTEEDTHWMCSRCNKRYSINFNFKTQKLSKI